MPIGRPAITGLHSQGIIDDIFKASGKKVTHTVRRVVQDAVHAEIRLAARQKSAVTSSLRAAATKTKKEVKVKKNLAKQVGIKVDAAGKVVKEGGKTVRIEPKIKTKNPAKKATKVANKTAAAKKMTASAGGQTPVRSQRQFEEYLKIRDKKLHTARAFFPDDRSFSRAMKEEAAEIRKARKKK